MINSNTKLSVFFHIVVTVLILWALFASNTFAQTPSYTPEQQDLLEEIREQAKLDAQSGVAAETTNSLNVLFGKKAEGVGLELTDVLRVYRSAYNEAKPSPSIFDKLPDMGVVIIGILTFFFGIIVALLRETIIGWIKTVKDRIYNRFAGHHYFHPIALRRYRQALIDKYQWIKIPFRPDRPLKMQHFYIPLILKGGHNKDQIDTYSVIAENKWLMVVGPPGSGKSMLLRNIVLAYAEDRLIELPHHPLPILLDLSRLSESDDSIENHLVDVLRFNDFPHAEDFISSSLSQGKLLLLFDGLDEVNSNERNKVVASIKNLLDTYEQCRAVITCRTAVYQNEFADTVGQTLEIAEFNDQQIQNFLEIWQKDMPPGKSIEQLIFSLQERPRILTLARNPLMLTIIAYLYTDTEFILPHSRAEFYDQAVDVLLQQWKGSHNRYKASHKRLILQHLALFNQDSGKQRKQDRRSIDLKTVLTEVKQVLPDLNLADKEAEPLLDEIVERSGLLLAIDGGARYQFAHLTLQEFFAASALSDYRKLQHRFEQDPNVWREPVKLWCGLNLDSTDLIEKVYSQDDILAFECLADAQKVKPEIADNIINHFKNKFGEPDHSGDAIRKAFAAVAADLRPRGKAIFDFLSGILAGPHDDKRLAAISTLPLTNLPRAAEVLAEYYTDPAARAALLGMGNLAVPPLVNLARDGNNEALADLQSIGTPKSSTALVEFLWYTDEQLATGAALRLASLISSPEVESSLHDYPLAVDQRNSKGIGWVWKPFDTPNGSSLPVIMDRVAYLVDQVVENQSLDIIPDIDTRIFVPLMIETQSRLEFNLRQMSKESPTESFRNLIKTVTHLAHSYRTDVKATPGTYNRLSAVSRRIRGQLRLFYQRVLSSELGNIESKESSERYSAIESALETLTTAKQNEIAELPELREQFVQETLSFTKSNQFVCLLNSWQHGTKFDLWRRFLGDPQPTPDDWQNVLCPVDYNFKNSWHYWAIFTLTYFVSLVVVFGLFVIPSVFASILEIIEKQPPITISDEIRIEMMDLPLLRLEPSLSGMLIFIPLLLLGMYWFAFIWAIRQNRIRYFLNVVQVVFVGFPYILIVTPKNLFQISREAIEEGISGRILGYVLGLMFPFIVLVNVLGSVWFWYVFCYSIGRYIPWPIVLGIWALLIGAVWRIAQTVQKRNREALNPLHGILDQNS